MLTRRPFYSAEFFFTLSFTMADKHRCPVTQAYHALYKKMHPKWEMCPHCDYVFPSLPPKNIPVIDITSSPPIPQVPPAEPEVPSPAIKQEERTSYPPPQFQQPRAVSSAILSRRFKVFKPTGRPCSASNICRIRGRDVLADRSLRIKSLCSSSNIILGRPAILIL